MISSYEKSYGRKIYNFPFLYYFQSYYVLLFTPITKKNDTTKSITTRADMKNQFTYCFTISSFSLVSQSTAKLKTCSGPRRPLRSHSLVCTKNHAFIVGIGPILDKEL